MKRKLNDKQQAFCREYLADFNASAAYIRAGYARKGAGQSAGRLLKNTEIQKIIGELVEKAKTKVELTVERVLQELMSIAFLDPADLLNDDGSLKALSDMPEAARRAIGGLEVTTRFDGPRGAEKDSVEITKVKIIDKTRTLEQLAKYLKMYADMEVNINLGLSDRLAAARNRINSK